MTRKVDGTERSGRGTAPSAAGGFGGADTALTRLARPFVPKPFRSTGGMSTSADTMASIGMGRHNIDDAPADDQVNVAAIVSRKTSDRRYLPRKLGNMRHMLHTTPVSESLAESDEKTFLKLLRYEEDLSRFVKNLTKESIDTSILSASDDQEQQGASGIGDYVTGIASSLAPMAAAVAPVVGDAYYGYRAIQDFKSLKEEGHKIEEILKESGIEINLFANPEENVDKIGTMFIASASDRAKIKSGCIQIVILAYNFLTGVVAAIPLEVIGLAQVDAALDAAIMGISTIGGLADPEGINFANEIYAQALSYSNGILENIEKVKRYLPDAAAVNLQSAFFFISNLALIYSTISSGDISIEQAEDPNILAEMRRKKKRANEISGVGSIAGFTGPVKGPQNPKQFYNTMAKVAGSEYLLDPLKTAKPKP